MFKKIRVFNNFVYFISENYSSFAVETAFIKEMLLSVVANNVYLHFVLTVVQELKVCSEINKVCSHIFMFHSYLFYCGSLYSRYTKFMKIYCRIYFRIIMSITIINKCSKYFIQG